MRNRTLAELLVRDSTTNADETLLIIIPLEVNQTELLQKYVNNFCAERNMNLLPLNITPRFSDWQDRIGFSEYACSACAQSYLDTSDLVSSAAENRNFPERFCSNYCRNNNA